VDAARIAMPPQVPAVVMASHTAVGARSHNEDDLRVVEGDGASFAVLSDGAGGHRDGAVASDIVVRMVAHALQQAPRPSPEVLVQALEQANACLVQAQADRPPAQRMHATVVVLWIDTSNGRALWAHAGDSRLYLVRRGAVKQLTRDDSLVQQLVDAGLLDADDARHHPRRNQLLVAMGSTDVEPQRCVCAAPLTVTDGDAFLLCTDGWWGELRLEDIDAALTRSANVEAWLADMARTVASRGGPQQDNYSAIGVWVGDPGEVTRFG
jgi:serine/threonine protein phosphatase PrpC